MSRLNGTSERRASGAVFWEKLSIKVNLGNEVENERDGAREYEHHVAFSAVTLWTEVIRSGLTVKNPVLVVVTVPGFREFGFLPS
jgi:hypothetical protein